MKTISKAPLLLLLALVACGEDPVLEAAREEAASSNGSSQGSPGAQPPGAPTPGQPGEVQPGEPGQGSPGAGIPEEPAPGDPSVPPPGGAPGGGAAGDGTIPPPPGIETVTITGTVKVDDYVRGAITIDVFDGDNSQQRGKRPDIVGRARLAEPGPFEMQIEKGTTVWLSAYADQDENNRPSKEDPLGDCSCNPLYAGKDMSGLVVELTRGHPPGE